LFQALETAVGPLAGRVVLEGGAGTGLATRPLVELGARVCAFDVSPRMLEHARNRAPSASLVVADGNTLPFRDDCADVCCFAQSWHWLDPLDAVPEVARVLRASGAWAGWWSHARADGQPWFDRYQQLLESSTTYNRRQRDIDWSRDVSSSRQFATARRTRVAWEREVPVDVWMHDERSKSYIGLLEPQRRDGLLAAIEAILVEAFPNRVVTVAYDTSLWVAKRRGGATIGPEPG
jgi:SAM-dependent methyltransferase